MYRNRQSQIASFPILTAAVRPQNSGPMLHTADFSSARAQPLARIARAQTGWRGTPGPSLRSPGGMGYPAYGIDPIDGITPVYGDPAYAIAAELDPLIDPVLESLVDPVLVVAELPLWLDPNLPPGRRRQWTMTRGNAATSPTPPLPARTLAAQSMRRQQAASDRAGRSRR
jgi:hypothetical protein